MVAERPCVEELRDLHTYRSVERRFDRHRRRGRSVAELRDERVYEVASARGRAVKRLVAKNGRSLTAAERTTEDARVARSVAERDPHQLRHGERDLKLHELLTHCDLRTIAREIEAGRATLVIELRGHSRKKARSPSQKLAQHLHGFLFVDEEDRQVVRAEAEVSRVRFWSGIAAVLDAGSLYFEQARIDGEVWLPVRSRLEYRGRFFLRGIDRIETAEFGDHGRYDTEVGIAYGK
jgi:hypothetical protein